ncbi:hypothetical protein AA103587_1794 [Gluconobacter kanchanaburiensis NBRC 103587]|nr:hypothetical protein AA103587_1794 [Gluconobacter kanchanaburiensis NBRC 103587]
MHEEAKVLPASQLIEGLAGQLGGVLQDLRGLEQVCFDAVPHEVAPALQGFDRLEQIIEQLAICCGQLCAEPGLKNVMVGPEIVNRITLGELREWLLSQPSSASSIAGNMELF